MQGHLDVLRVVHSCGVDMEQADEEGGTSPVHIAAANGNLEVLKFMHEIGVNMEVKGTIYLDTGEDGAPQLHSNVTPLTIAQTCTGFSPDVLTFLKSICTPSQQPGKRQRTLLFLPTIGRSLSVSLIGCGRSLLRCRDA